MRKLKPVELAVSSLVRLGKGMFAGDLLGSAIKVGPDQFPRVHELTQRCAQTLGIDAPSVFIQGRIDSLNAMTTGTDRESVIVIHSVMLDHLTDEELMFVIGHECGHIHNRHVVYLTTLHLLTRAAGAVLGGFTQPALLALSTWSRAAEVTCDRAGLLCCRDEDAGKRALLKLVTGSPRLHAQLNVDAYLQQLDEAKDGIGRAAELNKSHPYVNKRVHALRLFAQSALYRQSIGKSGGDDMDEVNRKVEQIVRVM
jgi:Zn-dependent protease with chaperone function